MTLDQMLAWFTKNGVQVTLTNEEQYSDDSGIVKWTVDVDMLRPTVDITFSKTDESLFIVMSRAYETAQTYV